MDPEEVSATLELLDQLLALLHEQGDAGSELERVYLAGARDGLRFVLGDASALAVSGE